MNKIRDWMHGKGRPVVIAVVCILALWIIVDYYRENHIEEKKSSGDTVISEPAREGADSGADPLDGETDTKEDDRGQSEEDSIQKEEVDLKDESVDADPTGDTEDSLQNEEVDLEAQETTQEDVKHSDAGLYSPGETITLGFAGDINFDESWSVMKHLRKKGKGISGCIDKKLIQQMRQDDAMILNNEFAFSDRGAPMKGKAYTFCSPTKNVKMLDQMGVDAVSLANNHIYDYGREAFLDTIATLKKDGIKYTGGGKNIKEAKKPVYLHIKGKTIAIIAATRAEKYILTPEAGKSSPGVFRTYNDAAYVKAIKKAKKKADYVIPFVHWGTEYSTVLESAQIQQAKDYINAGADLVVGAHTHCLQGVGYYKGKPIFYSLGNYWFNEKTLYTTLLQIKIQPNGKLDAYMMPCLQKNCETKLLTKDAAVKKFNRHINSISTNARLGKKGRVKRK